MRSASGRQTRAWSRLDAPRAWQRTEYVEIPGRTRAVVTRLVVGSPGGNAPTAVGTRGPPPAAGMQPMYGRYVAGLDDRPMWEPTKVTVRPVVIPGLTGLPSMP